MMKLGFLVWFPSAALLLTILFGGVVAPPRNPRVHFDRTIEAHVTIPAEVGRVLQRSCYDCHSYQTRWPWYSQLPGISGMLYRHVEKARRHLNLSDWSTKIAEGPEEAQASLNGICEELRSDSMPIERYRWLHRDAAVSRGEVETVCRWTASIKSFH